MSEMGKILVLVGLALVVLGALVWGLSRLGWRGLPGDLHYEGQHVRVYFPIVSSLVLSVLLTGLLWLWQWLRNR